MRRLTLMSMAVVVTFACGGERAGDASPDIGDAVSTDVATAPGEACGPVGAIHFICDVISPEDLAVVPDTDWVIVSGNQEGGRIQLVSVSQKTARVLFPSETSISRFDSETYPACPGPLDPEEGNDFRAHGLYLKPGEGDVHTLHAVHHGLRESVEVFEFNAGDRPPSLTWVGCAVAPEGGTFNAVVALPDGGFAATGPRLSGDISSGVLEWHRDTGWTMVPGSEDVRPNGLEISEDGEWFYVAGWEDERVIRLSRGQTPVQTDVMQLGFRPDNLRRAPDGLLYAAGHTDFQLPTEAFNVARINAETLAFERILHHPVIDGFAASTTAFPIGNDIWLGTNRGGKIAYFPAPRLNKIIERFEQGEAALANEHWRIMSLEHSPFLVDDLEVFLDGLREEGVGRPRLTPIVRIPHEADEDFHHAVKQILDAGAMGIVLPQVRTADEVTKLVRAMRYPPQRGAQYPEPRGRRGWGPTAATRVWGVTADEYARKADVWPLNPEGELLAIAMVETREIVENIDEILQVPGLGGLLIGAADLSLSLGVGTPAANSGAPEVQAAIRTVGDACKRHNALCGIYALSDVEAMGEQGFTLFPIPGY